MSQDYQIRSDWSQEKQVLEERLVAWCQVNKTKKFGELIARYEPKIKPPKKLKRERKQITIYRVRKRIVELMHGRVGDFQNPGLYS